MTSKMRQLDRSSMLTSATFEPWKVARVTNYHSKSAIHDRK